jgi:hypothetical protein
VSPMYPTEGRGGRKTPYSGRPPRTVNEPITKNESRLVGVVVLVAGVAKGLKKNLGAIPGKHSIDSLQKTAIWRVLQSGT